MTRAIALTLVLASATTLAAEPRSLKVATITPDGTLWSRELRATAQEIETRTDGAVRMKMYFGGVAGDETEMAARVAKGQLDGVASAGVLCDLASPTLRAISIPGLFTSRAEAFAVTQKLRPEVDAEAQKGGFAVLGVASLGQDVLFTRTPVRTLAELRALRMWRWAGDDAGIATTRAMGLKIVTTPVHEAMAAMESGRIDGFMAIPTAALVFQWSTRTRYLTSLRSGHLNSCILVANRAFDRLLPEQQQALRAAGAKLAVRMEEIAKNEDEELVGALFARQGLTVAAPSPAFRAEFYAAAGKARATLDETIVSRAVVDRVLKVLAEVRAK